jgi:sugar lactone lactonase YvrE
VQRRLPLLIAQNVGLVTLALVVTWLALPSPIGSLPWIPSPAPPLDGPYRENNALEAARAVVDVDGAEDLAFDDAGFGYSGLRDGRVVRFAVAGGAVETLANTGGRPLGIDVVDGGAALVIADASRGLLRLDLQTRVLTTLATTAEGVPFRCVNGVDVATDGTIYFTDASAVWGIAQFTEDILDQRPSGRVLRYDPRTKTTTVLLRDLVFANGVALTADESALLVAESGRYRLWRIALVGEQKNLSEVVRENLPGFPDNLQRTSRGTFWVAIYATRKRLLDAIHPYPVLKDATASLPELLRPKPPRWGFVVEVDERGTPLRSLQDVGGDTVAHVAVAKERDGQLWLGGLTGPLLRLPLP